MIFQKNDEGSWLVSLDCFFVSVTIVAKELRMFGVIAVVRRQKEVDFKNEK